MAMITPSDFLAEVRVKDAMRRGVVTLSKTATLEQVIRFFIKYKVNALLVVDQVSHGEGVISKTDLMAAYYAGLDIRSSIEEIISAPPQVCMEEDSLESALRAMQQHSVHRLYVLERGSEKAVGVLAYPDVVGLLYRYCFRCERSIRYSWRSRKEELGFEKQFMVRDAMTSSVIVHKEGENLLSILESLSVHRRNAVLILNEEGTPTGVVSKTNLMLAYKHGVPTESEAAAVMSSPVMTCRYDEHLASAIRKMIFSDLPRLFVVRNESHGIIGVLSMSDAAMVRSGSCRACIASRIEV
jgi:predicted transcriptional regulator